MKRDMSLILAGDGKWKGRRYFVWEGGREAVRFGSGFWPWWVLVEGEDGALALVREIFTKDSRVVSGG